MGCAPRASWPRTAWTSSECSSAARDWRGSGPTSSSTSSRDRSSRRRGSRRAAVTGCAGVERHRFVIRGQAAHAGHDADGRPPRRRARRGGGGAADREDRTRRGRCRDGGRGRLRAGDRRRLSPGVASMQVDLRHRDADALARMLASTREAVARSRDGAGLRDQRGADLEDRTDRLRPGAGRVGAGRLRERSPERPSSCPAGRCTTPPRWRANARRDDLLRRRSAASATRARRTPTRMTCARRSRRSASW